MGTITLPNVRATSDITINTRLKDGGVYIDWASLADIKALLYSDAQKAIAGRCEITVDQEDPTVLYCVYLATKPQYTGVNRLIIQCRYMDRMKTFDKAAFNIVRRTAAVDGPGVTIDDPEVNVEIEVTDVSSSVLDNAIAAALAAAEKALEAASKAPYIGANGHWFVWSSEAGEYVDTGVRAQGNDGADGHSPYIGANGHWFAWSSGAWTDTGVSAQGPAGKDGGILFPTFSVDAGMHLQMDTREDTGADRFDLTSAGHLTVEV